MPCNGILLQALRVLLPLSVLCVLLIDPTRVSCTRFSFASAAETLAQRKQQFDTDVKARDETITALKADVTNSKSEHQSAIAQQKEEVSQLPQSVVCM